MKRQVREAADEPGRHLVEVERVVDHVAGRDEPRGALAFELDAVGGRPGRAARQVAHREALAALGALELHAHAVLGLLARERRRDIRGALEEHVLDAGGRESDEPLGGLEQEQRARSGAARLRAGPGREPPAVALAAALEDQVAADVRAQELLDRARRLLRLHAHGLRDDLGHAHHRGVGRDGEAPVQRVGRERELRYFVETGWGGGGSAAVLVHAAVAIAAGMAETILVYRSRARGKNSAFGKGMSQGGRYWERLEGDLPDVSGMWHVPQGLITAFQEWR